MKRVAAAVLAAKMQSTSLLMSSGVCSSLSCVRIRTERSGLGQRLEHGRARNPTQGVLAAAVDRSVTGAAAAGRRLVSTRGFAAAAAAQPELACVSDEEDWEAQPEGAATAGLAGPSSPQHTRVSAVTAASAQSSVASSTEANGVSGALGDLETRDAPCTQRRGRGRPRSSSARGAGASSERSTSRCRVARLVECGSVGSSEQGKQSSRPRGSQRTGVRRLGMDDVLALAAELRQQPAAASDAPTIGSGGSSPVLRADLPHLEQQQQQQRLGAGARGALVPPHATPDLPFLNLGYACNNLTLRRQKGAAAVITNRSCWRRTFEEKGLAHISQMALANCLDLLRVLAWNRDAGIRVYRVSSGLMPWALGGEYTLEQLPDFESIAAALGVAGELARASGQRLTAHPPHYVKLASREEALVGSSLRLLDLQSQLFDLMGYAPSPENKLNIHVGGCYGSKRAALKRFAAAYRRLSPGAAARLTVENDDRPNSYSVADLLPLHDATGIPITFDAHHHRFCSGGLAREEALSAALATWPSAVRPVVHWSEPPECPARARVHPHAHSAFVFGPISLHGREGEVDVMLECKAGEQALLLYRDRLLPLEQSGLLPSGDNARWEQPLGRKQVAYEAEAKALAVATVGCGEPVNPGSVGSVVSATA